MPPSIKAFMWYQDLIYGIVANIEYSSLFITREDVRESLKVSEIHAVGIFCICNTVRVAALTPRWCSLSDHLPKDGLKIK
jgi:hypothetical protein